MTDVQYAAVQPLSSGDDQGHGAKMHIRVLGPVEVVSDGVDVRLGGPKQRTIVALLVAEVGKVVSVDPCALPRGGGGRAGSAARLRAGHLPELRRSPQVGVARPRGRGALARGLPLRAHADVPAGPCSRLVTV
jgi:hypothetical protein